MKIDVGKIALVAVMIAGIQTGVLYHRIDDLECQRDIYKSRYEDWEGVSKEIAEYADTLRDSLKARDRLDGKLLVEDAEVLHFAESDRCWWVAGLAAVPAGCGQRRTGC